MEDFSFAEGFGTMSQGTEFARFLRKNSVTCNKSLAAGPQLGTILTARPTK